MGHDTEDGPLRPTYRVERPPWIGLYSKRPYNGQLEYWAEPGLKNQVLRSGRFQANRPRYREEDPNFTDPKVPDGTSLSGPLGLDSTRHPNLSIKGDQPGNLGEFQRKLMENSLQYKRIAEKYKLSPEHPGIAVSPNLDDFRYKPVDRLGYGTFTTNKWISWGPRFFDKPLNEGTIEKVAAAAKYAAVLMLPITMAEIRATHSIPVGEFTARRYLRRYAQLSPFPIAVAASWAFTISASSAIRNKDDVKNHFIAGPATGLVVATLKDNITLGVITAFVVTILGSFWQYQRVSEFGVQGRLPPQQVSGYHGGPHHWKVLQLGDAAVPDRVV